MAFCLNLEHLVVFNHQTFKVKCLSQVLLEFLFPDDADSCCSFQKAQQNVNRFPSAVKAFCLTVNVTKKEKLYTSQKLHLSKGET